MRKGFVEQMNFKSGVKWWVMLVCKFSEQPFIVPQVHIILRINSNEKRKDEAREKTSTTYVQDQLSHFSKHLITIVPDTVEPKNFAVKLQELPQFVNVTRRLHRLRQLSLLAHARVRVFREILRSIYLNTFTFKIFLSAPYMKISKQYQHEQQLVSRLNVFLDIIITP